MVAHVQTSAEGPWHLLQGVEQNSNALSLTHLLAASVTDKNKGPYFDLHLQKGKECKGSNWGPYFKPE